MHYALEKVKMITSYLGLNCARTIITIYNIRFVPRVQNKQVEDNVAKPYWNVSIHVGVVEIVPQFCATLKNVVHGTTTKVANQNN